MITVHVLVDQYIHRWDGSSGELWFCVRPHVGSVADFRAWARDPDTLTEGGAARFNFVFQRADQQCPAELFPINLPAGIDVWHGLSEKGQASPSWSRYARSTSCRNSTGTAYATAFNRSFADHLKTEPVENNVLSSIEMHFYSGSEFDENGFSSRYATSSGQPLPVFRPIPGSSDTSMFWLLGLMHRIGGQSALADLHALASYELVLVDALSSAGSESTGPTAGRLASMHLPDALPGPAGDAERAFFNDWLPALPAGVFPKEIGPDLTVDLPQVLYCKPPRRNLMHERTAEGATVFRIPAAADGSIAATARPTASAPSKLVAMEVEVVRTSPDEAFSTLDLQLGLRLTGRLQPYRRSPVPLAPAKISDPASEASRLATIVEFQPDENCTETLARFLAETPAADVDRLLTASFTTATVSEQPDCGAAWTVKFIGAQAFAWEESKPRIRLLATPSAKARPAEAGKPRGLTRATAKLSVASGPKVTLSKVSDYVDDGGLTHTVGFWAAPTNPVVAAFNAAWVAAVVPTANASDVESDRTRMTQVFQDDYEFERAQSATSIEGSVAISTAPEAKVEAAAQAAGVPDPKDLNPYLNYAEGFADYNVLRQVQRLESGDVRRRDWSTQHVGPAAGCNGELLGIAQTMPFAATWSETPRDTIPDTAVVAQASWTDVRKHVAELYHVSTGAPSRSIGLALRHTFGARFDVRELSPTLPLPWIVDLPTAAETKARGNGTGARDSRPFVRVRYDESDPNSCTISFDQTVLAFEAPPKPADPVTSTERTAKEQAFASGTQAWRSLGELCDPKVSVSIALQPVAYDLFHKGSAGQELAPDWQSALRDLDAIEAADSGFVADLRNWAKSCFDAKSEAELTPFSRKLSLSKVGLGTVASIGRFDWTTIRSEDRDTHLRENPKDDLGVELKYVTDRVDSDDALHAAILNNAVATAKIAAPARARDKTIDGAWRSSQPPTVPKAPADAWSRQRHAAKDSVTPQLPDAAASTGAMTPFEDVMQSLREGTDWFPIPGYPDYSKLSVTPTLIPCGFCPVAPHPDLGRDTERLLETLLSTIQDYVDLALPSGTEQRVTGNAGDWRVFFRELEGASVAYAKLMTQIVDQLLRAQPANDAGTTPSVAVRSAAINGAMPEAVAAAIRGSLMRQPALYRTTKALLLSELSVTGPKATLSPLAGAQFTRWTKPWREQSGAGDATSVRLDAGRLVALETLPQSGPVTGGIAFIEPLEDSLYDNSFEVHDGGQRVEPFEAVIDADAARNPGWMWATQLPTTPISRNQGDTNRRRVPLASRRPVAPPVAIGAIALPLNVVNLSPKTTIKLSKLLEGSAAVDPAGDFDVEATLPPDTTPVRFENDVYRLIYLVQGDEEGDEAGSATAFQNDLFTLEASQPDLTATSASTQRVQPAPVPESALSKELRLLGAATPGTVEARMRMAKILPRLATVASDYVKRPEPGVVPTAGLQIQVGAGGAVSIVVSGPGKPARLRNAAVLRPRADTPIADKAIRIVVLDVMTDVWTDVGFALRQSRNAGTVLDGYRFDPYFLTSAVPATPPSRHRPTKAAKNVPTDWQMARVLKLPGRSIGLAKLLALIAQADVGTHAETLLTPALALASGYRLIVSVWAEQFQRPEWGGKPVYPEGRHLPWTMAYTMSAHGLKAAPDVEFTASARHFSIDLQWFTPSGESAMRLERVFATA